jgi:hypothetical protein
MGNDIAEPRCKTFLLGIIEMVLVAAKDHLVFRERRFDCDNDGLGQIAGEPDVADLGTDSAGQRANIEIDREGRRTFEHGHGNPPPQASRGRISRAAIIE